MAHRLTRRTKLAYGIGEVTRAVIQNIRVVFLLYFLTNVAGLPAALAGTVLLVGRIWDGVNDPIVGWLSDRTRSRFGQRYPWMVAGAIPLGLFTVLQWVVPPFAETDPHYHLYLFLYYTVVALLFDAAFSAVMVPYSALAPDLAQDYDARVDLSSFQTGFLIAAGIGVLLLAQLIFAGVPSFAQGYLILGGVCAAIAMAAIFLCVWGTYGQTLAWSPLALERQPPGHAAPAPRVAPALVPQLATIFRHREFQLVTGIYVLTWVSIQGMVAILPYFIQSWMKLPMQHVTQMAILMQTVALVTVPLGRWFSQRPRGKKGVLFLGLPVAMGGQISLSLLSPDQVGLMYGCAIAIGIGLSTVYLIPFSMLPDVIDLDELRYGHRREGLFYALMMQMQKFGLAIALFLLSQGLSWGGLVSTTGNAPNPVQPSLGVLIVRLEIGLLPALVMGLGLVLAWHYPISRDRHRSILLQLNDQNPEVF
ncbi:MFS transporter [Leptolyngbya sp. CCNP1308]|uniref:MFS transporter n=1 Tax=Leptolyngbya sp. CCNP1308 TaxID=3110255 RepID=UPI002B207A3F|nr:MFS transporter [Leptolyngbya sp. CCNP1308]MEA5448051.1 MFS transporter [Leptolyngbya sp. CCNP1308]